MHGLCLALHVMRHVAWRACVAGCQQRSWLDHAVASGRLAADLIFLKRPGGVVLEAERTCESRPAQLSVSFFFFSFLFFFFLERQNTFCVLRIRQGITSRKSERRQGRGKKNKKIKKIKLLTET